MEELVAVARIAKTRGLRGECVADILTDFPERFAELENVILVLPGGVRREAKIVGHFFQKGRVVLKFDGVTRPEAAEELRNADVCIPESEAVELDEGEYFDWELEGCEVSTLEGEKIGKVKELMRTGAAEILVVAGETKEFLIPFAEQICVEVDVDNKLIRIDAPEGLLDF